jgi:thiamine pyrophosphate-dependent acetolactate synthase large subunit-like protein
VCGGDAVHRACREADVVLAVGCRFSSWLWDDRGTLVSHGPRIIHIDTDPGTLGKNVAVDIGLCADAKVALEALVSAVTHRVPTPPARPWLGELQETYRAYRGKLRGLAESGGTVMHPAALAQAIGECLPRDALATFDGGHTTFWGNDFTQASEPRTRFNEPGMSQLGFGLPWALTLKLLHPTRPVFNITGDGAFGFSLQELDTARRLGLPVITLIHNNASWGVIKLGYEKAGFAFESGSDYGTSLAGTDYAAIAMGFGGFGEVVQRVDDVQPAIRRAIASGLPAVIDCRVRFEPHPGMPHFAKMSSAGA